MEISLNLKANKLVSATPNLGFRRKKDQAISCRVVDILATKTNFYKVLSLDCENVGLPEIKKAYRRMALRYHPDVCATTSSKEESTQRFLELRMAYETLSDPVSRLMYDYELSLITPIDYDSGLTNPIGFGFGNSSKEERRSSVIRDVKRSHSKMQRMKNTNRHSTFSSTTDVVPFFAFLH